MIEDFWKYIDDSKHILIVSHVNPDGDTLGSSLALYSVLKEEGKKVYLYNATKVLPVIYDFLPNIDKVKSTLPKKFDLVVSCDCADFSRLKIEKGEYRLINIDHHQSNDYFGDLNIVDDTKSSVGEIMYEIISSRYDNLSKETATCLYTSIVEDSGFFRYTRVNQKTFEIASKLVSCGISPSEISFKLKGRQSLAKVRLLGYIYNNFELLYDAKIAYVYLSREVFEKTGARVDDTKNLAANLLDIVNVEVSVMILKKSDGTFKVSIRSTDDYEISSVASAFGGGGHPNAAGFDAKSDTDVEELKREILKQIENIIKDIDNE